jgi:hypothetical protein
MAFRIRKKRKIAKQRKGMIPQNDQTDKEKLQELAEWDAIAEASKKAHRSASNTDSFDEEP